MEKKKGQQRQQRGHKWPQHHQAAEEQKQHNRQSDVAFGSFIQRGHVSFRVGISTG
jgi:hypothetical protein